jgi:hypothetical protein
MEDFRPQNRLTGYDLEDPDSLAHNAEIELYYIGTQGICHNKDVAEKEMGLLILIDICLTLGSQQKTRDYQAFRVRDWPRPSNN